MINGQPQIYLNYVVGFLFSSEGHHVVLIKKKKPAWQARMLNGVGGRIESGEPPPQAMEREFLEETSVSISARFWEEFVIIKHADAQVHFFRAFKNLSVLNKAKTTTEEEVSISLVFNPSIHLDRLSNLQWLLPLALDQDIRTPTIIFDGTTPMRDAGVVS